MRARVPVCQDQGERVPDVNRTSLVTALCVVTATSLTLVADAPTRVLDGEAFGRDGRLAYREFHVLSDDPTTRQVTSYRDAEGREFGRMDVDFSSHRFSPHYRMVDDRHQTSEMVKRDGSLVTIARMAKGETTSKILQHSGDRELIVGPGFDEYLRTHWDALLAGTVLVCDFVVPSRMQIVAFRIEYIPDPTNLITHRFVVKVDNFLLRLLAPQLRVEYDRITRGIQRYDGPSNVNDASDHTQMVTIRYPTSRAAAEKSSGQH